MSAQSNSSQQIISLPQGGGALSGIGEKFSPDLFTGTGNFTLPLALPSGRNGFQPELNLVYSTGNGNSPFGLGWGLSVPGVSRKTSNGVPRYNEAAQKLRDGERRDVFILSGAEDLVPVKKSYPESVRYRPRTESLFACITHHRGQTPRDNYWEVKSKDGLISIYGRPSSADSGPAVITKPDDPSRIFAWKLTRTTDTFGNLIDYDYIFDSGEKDGHRWSQPLLKRVRYVDYGNLAEKDFLVRVEFEYEDERTDPFSDYRAGFAIRTTKLCKSIKVSTRTADGKERDVRQYVFSYRSDPFNGVSLLQQMEIIGYDDNGKPALDDDQNSPYSKQLPPLTFDYTRFAPETQRFEVIEGRDLPARALSAPDMEMVDLHGSGLPDILEMNGSVRYWRNLGDGRFDMPRPMLEAPPHSLADPGVTMIDANGDGHTDLLVTQGALSGYYSLQFDGLWNRQSFRKYQYAPSFDLKDPEVRLLDLTGDGITDVLRSGTRLECFFSDLHGGWLPGNTRWVERQPLEVFPNVNFSDPRVKLADMSGDGLQDIVLVHDGNVEYWPNLGHGNWGKRLSMRRSPRFPYGYDPQRILIGDVDGDGLADIVYVDYDKVLLWLNQSGNAWSKNPVIIQGTPPSTDMDHVRLVDLHGTGVSGVLWSTAATSLSRHRLMFLDFTGGQKPYILDEMNNHMGAVTKVQYRPSTFYYLADRKRPETRWRTPLPFPVQVVATVEVIDEISRGKLTTEYRYHHGYWDGAEREFRGFGMVEQLDTETIEDYHAAGLHGDLNGFQEVHENNFSKPTLTKTWFHQGPVGEEFGDWAEIDYTGEYWQGDPQLLRHTEQVNSFLSSYNDRPGRIPSPRNRRIKRDALRTMRGSILRSELYALDGSQRQDRPYTVNEYAYGLKEIAPPLEIENADRTRIFFPHPTFQRTTQWERGDDPMTQFAFTDYLDENNLFDDYGRPHRQTAVAMPRLLKHQHVLTGAVVRPFNPNETRILSTHTHTFYAVPTSGYIHNRVAQVKTHELNTPPSSPDALTDVLQITLTKQWAAAQQIHARFNSPSPDEVRLIGHQLNHYDGPDFEGLDVGQLGDRGALTHTEALVFTGQLLDEVYEDRRPGYLGGTALAPQTTPSGFGINIGYRKEPPNASANKASYYTDTLRQRLSTPGLPLAFQDALKHETVIQYDEHELLPVKVLDAAGMETLATYNYRLLQPESMTEPNGNSTHIIYNPVGLPHKQYIVGRDAQGNATLGGTPEKPEIGFEYNFMNFDRAGKPIFVHTYRRIHHASDNLSDDIIQTREYSDGFNRLIQTRTQAEDFAFGDFGDEVGLAPQSGSIPDSAVAPITDDRVTVSGWQVFDNKGRVVQKYEPFFDSGWEFQSEQAVKKRHFVSMFYDPRGQLIRTHNPDNSEQRVIYGAPRDPLQLRLTQTALASTDVPDNFAPTPWETYTYDPNDLAALTHSESSDVPTAHHFTPASVVVDGMGRARCAVARNGSDAAQDWLVTRSDFDIRGNLLVVTDALGREAFRYHYDLLNRVLSVNSIDAGRRTSVLDAQGNLIEYRDSKGSLVLRTYDSLNRPKELRARNDNASAFTLRERIEYGDEGTHALARQHNTLGKPVKHYDEAGLLEMSEYDLKGNLLEKTRRTVRDDMLANGWQVDWSATNAEDALESTVYSISTSYDALNRPTEVVYPEDVDGERKKLTPRYNRAGALEAVSLDDTDYVQHIAYNAKGQRVLIAYGNGVMTRYAYDPQTFRLARLRTDRIARPSFFSFLVDLVIGDNTDTMTFEPTGSPIQDFTYSYDLAGNIYAIEERTHGGGFRANPDALLVGDPVLANLLSSGDALIRRFEYDPIYRLTSATGRACKDTGQPRGMDDDSRCGFYAGGAPTTTQDNAPDLTEGYVERYSYDPAGNMLELLHQPESGATWKRVFGMGELPNDRWTDAPNNRLTTLLNGSTAQRYQFDDNGNLIRQNNERHHTWDQADRMIGYRVQATPGSPASVEVRYLYGADGMRVKKWVRNQQQQVNSTVYIDGAFEHHRQSDTTGTAENNSLHVIDNQSRIALVRVGAPLDERDASPRVQYHFGDHLGSSYVVLGGGNATSDSFINREEYFPYGETSFGSFAKKRYRYSGKERDEESGLYYYGARYLAPWLVRWVSCDPVGATAGTNLYAFVKANPMRLIDPVGLAEKTGTNLNGFTKETTKSKSKGPRGGTSVSYQTTYKPDVSGTKGGYASIKSNFTITKDGKATFSGADVPIVTKGDDVSSRGIARLTRSEHISAFTRDNPTATLEGFNVTVVEDETVRDLKAGKNFLETRIGRHLTDAFERAGFTIDSPSLESNWSSYQEGYIVKARVTPKIPTLVEPVAAISRSFGAEARPRFRMGGMVAVAAIGMLQDTPVALTDDGKVTYSFDDPIYGVHTGDAMDRELDYALGEGSKPPWMEQDQENPGFAIGLGIGVGGVAGGLAGAVIGGLTMANIYMYCAYRD